MRRARAHSGRRPVWPAAELACASRARSFFWAFPSEVANKRRKRQELLEAQLAEQRAKRAELAGKLEAQRASCPDSEERTAALRRLDAARATSASLQAELAQFAANDPAYLEKVKKLEDSGLAHANRWTDGLFLMKSFLEKLHWRNAEIDGFFETAGVDTEKLEYMTCETLLTPPRTAAMSSGGARKKAGGASGGGSGKGKKRPAPEAIEDD